MSDIKPITLYYAGGAGPNPPKVAIVLTELDIPFELSTVGNVKGEAYTAINPNGRVPAIHDPNTDITLWESGAIIEYLVSKYDKEGKLTVTDEAGQWHLKQYLHFQMSGQGPYFGQGIWFHKFHKEDVPSAKERYSEQIIRVVQVLDNILKDKKYLIGDKCTYADLSFIPWNNMLTNPTFLKAAVWDRYDVEKNYPHYTSWHTGLMARPGVKAAYARL